MRITEMVVTDAFAGTERYVVEVSTELARRGHDVAVVGGEADTMRRLLGSAVSWSAGGAAAEALRSTARGGRRDIVHSHTPKADFVAAMAAPATRGRRVSTRHITGPRGYTKPARMLAKPLRSAMARELAVSQFVADSVESTVDCVIVNGVRSVPSDDVARDRTVLIASRLAPEKDTETALRAWAASGLGDAGWRLLIAGDGDERELLERQASELGVTDSCDFLGWVGDPTLLFRTAGILLAPARGEPCGLTILEAMAHAMPVVYAGSGGPRETVGLAPSAAWFTAGDAEGAAALLKRLAGDSDGTAAYGRELQQLQRERFTIETHVDQLESVYLDVMAGH